MEVEVQAHGGVHIDLATKGDIDDLKSHFAKWARRPTFHVLSVEGSAPSTTSGSGPVWANCGTPPAGKIWRLLGVTLVPLANVWQSSIASVTAAVYVGGQGPSQLKIPALVVPSVTAPPHRQLIRFGQTLWVGFQGSGLTTAGALGANCEIVVGNMDDPGVIDEI